LNGGVWGYGRPGIHINGVLVLWVGSLESVYGCHGFSFLSVLVVAGAWTDGKESAPLSHLFLVPSWCCRGDGGRWYGMAFGGVGCQIKEEHGGGGCCHMGVANQK
jgi:hypothetical protein